MATDQQFCLRWNNHQSTLISVFDSLLENGTLVDCTLAAEGKYLKAHKVVLSACSPYLETLLSQHYEKHPIVILKDVKFTELKSMMDYMYRGEVNISQDQLGTFLKAAESLQIKGLSDNGDDATGPTTKRQEASARPSVTEVRNVETKRPAPSADLSDASREGSISPSSLRKRRRTRRSSQGDDPDSHLDSTSNACDFPINTSQTTTPLSVPSTTVVPTPVQNLPKQIVKQEPSISRIDNLNSTIAPESGLLKEKIEPPSEPLLEPKTEYLDYMNNENSIEVEDLTLDDDEDLDSSMDASRPGPSHGDMSNQGYQWPMGDQSGTDEIFMAAQQAVGAATGQQRDSQECQGLKELYEHGVDALEDHDYMVSSDSEVHPLLYLCTVCTQQFRSQALFLRHSCVEQADPPCLDVSGMQALLSEKLSTSTTTVKPQEGEDQEGAFIENETQVVSDSDISLVTIRRATDRKLLEGKPNSSQNDATRQMDLPQTSNNSPTIKQKYMRKNYNLMCSKCGGFYKTPFRLKKHVCGLQPKSNPLPSGTFGKPPYNCECGKVIINYESYNRHIHHICPFRKEVSTIKSERRTFMETLGDAPYKCDKCGWVLKTKRSSWDHFQKCGKDLGMQPKSNPLPQGTLGKPPYECKCGKVILNYETYNHHIHHVCPFRKEVNTTKTERRKFIQSLGVAPYTCDKCGTVVKRKHSFWDHFQKCVTPNQHKCQFCGNRFHTLNRLRKHLRDYHALCSFCKKEFMSKSELEDHQKKDHLKCCFCMEMFNRKIELEFHIQKEHLSSMNSLLNI